MDETEKKEWWLGEGWFVCWFCGGDGVIKEGRNVENCGRCDGRGMLRRVS